MAEKRCFTKKITESDAFLDMPLSAQCLYFHLNMEADDDGFVNNPKKVARMLGASDDDLKLLIMKSFILVFESGVIVIKHFRMHNSLQNDRYHRTSYLDEFKMLGLKSNKSYTFIGTDTKCIQNVSNLDTNCIQNVSTLDTDCIQNVYSLESEHNITEHNITKNNINKDNICHFVPPTLEEVDSYCKERKNNIDAQYFIDFYQSKGWMVGKNKMKDWKASVRTWERNNPTKVTFSADEMKVEDQDINELRRKMFGDDWAEKLGENND